MSDTPWTDVRAFIHHEPPLEPVEVVAADYVRQLERNLTEANDNLYLLQQDAAARISRKSVELEDAERELAELRERNETLLDTVEMLQNNIARLVDDMALMRENWHPSLYLLAVERTGWRRLIFGRWAYNSEPFRRDIQRRKKYSKYVTDILKPWERLYDPND